MLSEAELEEELAAQAAHIDAGLCRLLELAAECERRLPWADDGTTFAAWLAWRCSLLPRQAREHERVGKRLAELPLTHEAFSRGELSYAKVSVLTRIAERKPSGGCSSLRRRRPRRSSSGPSAPTGSSPGRRRRIGKTVSS